MRQTITFRPRPISKGQTATFTFETLFRLRVDRLVIPSHVASSLKVKSFRIAGRPQFLNSQPLEGSYFTETAIDGCITYDTCAPGQTIAFELLATANCAEVSPMLVCTRQDQSA